MVIKHDAILRDWPENQPEMEYTLEAAEARLEKACDAFLQALDSADDKQGETAIEWSIPKTTPKGS